MSETENMVIIKGSPYAKTPEALETILNKLRETGFQVENLRESEHQEQDEVSIRLLEQGGQPLWSATLGESVPIHIYETWHWAPLPLSSTLYRRIIQSAGKSYNQDLLRHIQHEEVYFNTRDFADMGIFIRHFTTLDADAWDRQSQNFRRDGVGGLEDIKAFCRVKK